MRNRHHQTIRNILAAALLLCAGISSHAQNPDVAPGLHEPPKPEARSIEDLNYLGGAAAFPPFTDNLIPVDSSYRQAMFRHGVAFRVNAGPGYTQNLLDAPVDRQQQVYVGQAPFFSMWTQPILTADLRQLHLRRTQLFMGAVWNWVTWEPAGPKSLQMWNLHLYKVLGEDRVQIKAGYVANNMNFIGLFVGGSTATGSQGVYAVLPFEVGMSYFPITAPSFNVRFNGPRHLYFKPAAQRSIDPQGGPREIERNHTGFRFVPHGDKLLVITEGGYQRSSAPDVRQAWFRTGYLHNFTEFKNFATGDSESGNYCAFALMDYQLTQPDRGHPSHGIYAGGSAMTVPDTLNPYARYYELRAYENAPFRSRPNDVIAAVASRTGYSRYVTDNLVAQGKTVWRAGTTLTGSYSLRTSPGSYVSAGLTYLYGPAITPRVPNALTFLASWSVFF